MKKDLYSFEDFLASKHAKQYEGLDDEMPDDYADWEGSLDTYELIRYANEYARAYSLESEKMTLQRIGFLKGGVL